MTPHSYCKLQITMSSAEYENSEDTIKRYMTNFGHVMGFPRQPHTYSSITFVDFWFISDPEDSPSTPQHRKTIPASIVGHDVAYVVIAVVIILGLIMICVSALVYRRCRTVTRTGEDLVPKFDHFRLFQVNKQTLFPISPCCKPQANR